MFTTLVMAGCSGSNGKTGATGPQGPAGPQGPTGSQGPSSSASIMPVIQSISVWGLPASPGNTITAVVNAQSASGSTLTYTWTTFPSTNWVLTSGADMPTATITAPVTYGVNGTASVEVSDTNGLYSIGVIALSTKDDTDPVISSYCCTA